MRWLVLLLGMSANLSQGMAYAGSVISVPLLMMVGITGAAEVKSHWAGIFTLCVLFLPVGMLTAGKLADKFSPRLPIALGALFYAAGLIASAYVTSYTMLCITFGVMLSLGSGFAYGPIVTAAVQRFPDKKGLASGLSVSALGFGPVVIAPTCAYMLEAGYSIQSVLLALLSQNSIMLELEAPYRIQSVLIFFGIISLATFGLAALFTGKVKDETISAANSPVGAKKSAIPHQSAAKNSAVANVPLSLTWNEMIKTGRFWMLFALLLLGTMPGLMVISGANGIFQSLGGFDAKQAAFIVAILGCANALGRFLWGTISDYTGRTNALAAMFALCAATMFVLPFSQNPTLLIVVIIVIGTTYGGYLGLFPSFCAEAFGMKNMAVNYAVLFIAFSAAAFAGPRLYASIDQQVAFFVAGTLLIAGCVGTFVYKKIIPLR
jgi:OFA family oxalate/formate antiporter-like MFS transporter